MENKFRSKFIVLKTVPEGTYPVYLNVRTSNFDPKTGTTEKGGEWFRASGSLTNIEKTLEFLLGKNVDEHLHSSKDGKNQYVNINLLANGPMAKRMKETFEKNANFTVFGLLREDSFKTKEGDERKSLTVSVSDWTPLAPKATPAPAPKLETKELEVDLSDLDEFDEDMF